MIRFLTLLFNQATALFMNISSILTTVYGWICAVCIFIGQFFIGYEKAIIAVVVCVALDTIWGIAAQIKQGRFTRSELGREGMLSKWALYASVLIAFIHIENAAGIESHTSVIVVSSMICLVEVWSMSGSALIINPNMPFLRIFRKVLTGEIASKMKITPAEVDEYFSKYEEKQNHDSARNQKQ